MVHLLQQLCHHQVWAPIQGMHPPALNIKPPQGIGDIHVWVSQLENWHIQACNCQRFSPCHFLLQQWLLTMEYPSESAPSLSGEDGEEFLMSSLAGHCLWDLPLGCELGTLKEWLPPSSRCPIHAALGEHSPPGVAWSLTH